MLTIDEVLDIFRTAGGKRRIGDSFERLSQRYLLTEPRYADQLEEVYLWGEFPLRESFAGGGKDLGIDLVAKTKDGEYWAVQCKCYAAAHSVNKANIDSFLSMTAKTFLDEAGNSCVFTRALWISTTDKWGANAEAMIRQHQPPVTRISLSTLRESPVDWEKLVAGFVGSQAQYEPFTLRAHQLEALEAARSHYSSNDRGRMIMACGTGKTFTSLRIAEDLCEDGDFVLFLVPSIALLGQSLGSWLDHKNTSMRPLCVCSDSKVSSKKRSNVDDDTFTSVVDLAEPANTNPADIAKWFLECLEARDTAKNEGSEFRASGCLFGEENSGSHALKRLNVVFSTYQSIDAVIEGQALASAESGADLSFDLVISDEAHRTTGVHDGSDDISSFVKVHYNTQILAKRRLYMTATPRLYGEDAKDRARGEDVVLCSMDDVALYGDVFYSLSFGKAVQLGLLSDYRVLVFTITDDLPVQIRRILDEKESSDRLEVTSAAKLVACVSALNKISRDDSDELEKVDPEPMRTAVAFTHSIANSKRIESELNMIGCLMSENTADIDTDALDGAESDANEVFLWENEMRSMSVYPNCAHVDGKMSAMQRDESLHWLKSVPRDGAECRILSNVRCLSEGVDVPSLDAVLFLSPKNSQIDIVQSVGRVMRKAEAKKYGYIIIPVVLKAGANAEEALNNSEDYKTVWSVLRALRAHDERFEIKVQQLALKQQKVGKTGAVIGESGAASDRSDADFEDSRILVDGIQLDLNFIQETQGLIYAKLVQRVGSRRYWEDWAGDVGTIVQNNITQIAALVEENAEIRKRFSVFHQELRANINNALSKEEVVEMLAQHLITGPIFNALFDDGSFEDNNPISRSMRRIIDEMQKVSDFAEGTRAMQGFYTSVADRVRGVQSSEGRQKIITELYETFFKLAFPLTVEKLGIVYTPIEIADFILHSTDFLLQKYFGRHLSDEGVHVLDPFTGTGTFMARLLECGLINDEDLLRKYHGELHANEILLLAYYIAAVNIENSLRWQMKARGIDEGETVENSTFSFDGICLTDSFELGERNNVFTAFFPDNSQRVVEQQKQPLMVILGNPPYSIGQKSANDNAQNASYKQLEARIDETYAKKSTATNKNSLYDSYVKAFRWASDRLDEENGGIVAFITNGSWIDNMAFDGFRACLEEEFSAVYCYHLRGDQRTSGELSRREGGKIFGSGSRTPIAICLLVKDPNYDGKAQIYYHDIGDYLSREDKLERIKTAQSVENVDWGKALKPNVYHDWINQRDENFENMIPLENAKKFGDGKGSYFVAHSLGVNSSRDVWVYDFSKESLKEKMQKSIQHYNEIVVAFHKQKENEPQILAKEFIPYDSALFTWDRSQVQRDLPQKITYQFREDRIYQSIYRPFVPQNLYFTRELCNCIYRQPAFFPEADSENLLICVSGLGAKKDFSAFVVDKVPCYDMVEKGQCFPLYWYEENSGGGGGVLQKIRLA
ncbi:MAG: type ISP restriction/modification enzyme, partial [Bradymonadia bacterium]